MIRWWMQRWCLTLSSGMDYHWNVMTTRTTVFCGDKENWKFPLSFVKPSKIFRIYIIFKKNPKWWVPSADFPGWYDPWLNVWIDSTILKKNRKFLKICPCIEVSYVFRYHNPGKISWMVRILPQYWNNFLEPIMHFSTKKTWVSIIPEKDNEYYNANSEYSSPFIWNVNVFITKKL